VAGYHDDIDIIRMTTGMVLAKLKNGLAKNLIFPVSMHI